MAKIGKLLAWLFLLALVGYVAYSVMTGSSTESPTGNVVLNEQTGEEVPVLSYPDCMDLDDGKNYQVRANAYNTHDNKPYQDYCEDGNTLVEYFCNNQYPDRISVECDCFKGACRS